MNETSRALCAQYVLDGQWADVERLLGHIDVEIREAAAVVCGAFASQKRLDLSPVVAALEKRLGDESEVAKEAAYALAFQYLGQKKYDEARALLGNAQPVVRQAAALGVSNAAQASIDVAPVEETLMKMLGDADRGTVSSATRALVLARAMRKDRAGVMALLAHPAAGAAAKIVVGSGLCDVAAEDDVDGVRTWLAAGAPPDPRNSEGATALLVAAKAGASRAVAALLEVGANPDLMDDAKRTPLMHAAFQGHEEVVRMLLAKGADPNVVASSDFTALDYALKTGQLGCAKALQEKGAKMGDIPSVMSFVCNDGNVEACRILLAHRPKLDVPDGNGMTPLMYAAMRGNEPLVSLLLEAGADPKVANAAGKTAAAMAVAGGHEAIAKRLG